MGSAREFRAEVAVVVLAIAAAALFLFEGRKLKPGVFEPIGPGAVPMGVAVVVIVLALGVLLERILLSRRRERRARIGAAGAAAGAAASAAAGGSEAAGGDDAAWRFAERWPAVLGIAALTVGYVAAMELRLVGYAAATVVYTAAAILVASEERRRTVPWAIGLALAFGLGLDRVFRTILVADLP